MTLSPLPLPLEVEDLPLVKLSARAHHYLGELKGIVQTIPNEKILLGLLPLQEAQSSSEIENIVTTTDDLYKSKVENNINLAVKEVRDYESALLEGFNIVAEEKLLTNRTICRMQAIIVANDAGFRKQAGTVLKNAAGETIYTPPQAPADIIALMANLEKFINDDSFSDFDPLIKMAIIHHQFESIHPFYDGNGRVGRIICILYLCRLGLLDLPILYLSRYIISRKNEYYRLLQQTRDEQSWREWIKFMLEGVIFTALETRLLIEEMGKLMQSFGGAVRSKRPKMYSQDLISALFTYPYTKVEFIEKELRVHSQTARTYLNKLAEDGLLEKVRSYKGSYYINRRLIELAISVSSKAQALSSQP